jgi:exonuclease SbcD
MKFLHTADWHLGRQFEGHSLDDDHAIVLDQIFAALQIHKPDALIIAGDVFDRTAPPETAVRLFNAFIERTIAETTSAIVIIAGNHDSADRIGAMSMLADRRRALVRGPLSATEHPLILHDAHGPVAISALPFGYEYAAREAFGDPTIKSPADVMRAEVAAARPHIPSGARWVIVAHAFVTGAAPSTTERPLTRVAGGIETVPADVFDGAHYVALGHIHRPQAAGAPHIRYSGSPLAFAFDEEGNEKSFALVDLAADGTTSVDLIPFHPRRTVRTLKGTLEDILRLPPSDDFVTVVLTDEGRLIEPMKRLRERFPFACGLSYARDLKSRQSAPSKPAATSLDDPAAVATEFLTHMRSTPPTPAESNIIAGALARLTTADEDAAA